MTVRFLALLLTCQLVGEVLTVWSGLLVPGPVLGMLLLFLGLLVCGKVPKALGTVTETLLRHLSLLFVPAGVGVMLHAATMADQWQAIVVALVGSALVTIVVTAWTMQLLVRARATDES